MYNIINPTTINKTKRLRFFLVRNEHGCVIIIKNKKITWQFTGLMFIEVNFANKRSFFIIPSDLRLQDFFDQLLVCWAKSEPVWQIQSQHSHNMTQNELACFTHRGSLPVKPRKAFSDKKVY